MAHNGDGRLRQSFGGVLAANRGVVFCWRFDVIRGIVIRAGESYKGHMAHLQSHLQKKLLCIPTFILYYHMPSLSSKCKQLDSPELSKNLLEHAIVALTTNTQSPSMHQCVNAI